MASSKRLHSVRDEIAFIDAEIAKNERRPTVRGMWEQRRAELQRSLGLEEFRVETGVSVEIVFNGDPVVGREAIELGFASDALESFQALVSNVYAERVSDVADRGPVRGRNASKLFIEDVVHGSMGFILVDKPDDQTEAFPTELSESVETALALIDQVSSVDPTGFDIVLRDNSPRSISSLRNLTRVMHNAGAYARISTERSDHSISKVDLEIMLSRLNEAVKEEDGVLMHGELKGIFPQREEFEFIDAVTSVTLHGKASESVLVQYLDPEFRRRYLNTAVIGQFKRTIIRRAGQAEVSQYILEHVREDPQRRSAALPST